MIIILKAGTFQTQKDTQIKNHKRLTLNQTRPREINIKKQVFNANRFIEQKRPEVLACRFKSGSEMIFLTSGLGKILSQATGGGGSSWVSVVFFP